MIAGKPCCSNETNDRKKAGKQWQAQLNHTHRPSTIDLIEPEQNKDEK
jgi:hypothetical protein